MGSRRLDGWEFTCDNLACGKQEAIYKRKDILSGTPWMQGEMDRDGGGMVGFTACEPKCLLPAVEAMLGKADLSEAGIFDGTS